MTNLGKILSNKARANAVNIPVILDLTKTKQASIFRQLLKNKVRFVVDDIEEQLQELFAIRNPTLVYTPQFSIKFAEYLKKLESRAPLEKLGKWVFFPWLSVLVHLLDDADFQTVRTARNRNLINENEQKKFYNATIGIAGQSVGNSVALSIVLQGGGRHLRIADHDRLALSNLNRIRAGVQNLGMKKVEMTARQIYELDPYANIELFPEGLNPKNIRKFFAGPPKLDIVVDEVDNLAIKYLIREQARKSRIPLAMGADNGDGAVIDIERYDQNPKVKFFHGRIGKVTYQDLLSMNKFRIGQTIARHIGMKNVTKRTKQSLSQMGKTLVSWPQLGGAALLNGSAIAYCVRRILNSQSVVNNRALIFFDEALRAKKKKH